MPDHPPDPENPFFVYGLSEALVEVHLHEPRPPLHVPERLVHDLWQQQRFNRETLQTVDRRPLSILHPGLANTHGGPDFRDARVQLDGHLLEGDVEIHVHSAEWENHGHRTDPAYRRTILHVTLFADVFTGRLQRDDGHVLPELVLLDRLQTPVRSLLYDYHRLAQESLPCASFWEDLPAETVQAWLSRRGMERIAARASAMAGAYLTRPELETLLHRALFHALGAEPNGSAMEHLAERIPLSLVRTMDDPIDLEAIHLGVAGLLPLPPGTLMRTDRATADALVAREARFQAIQARWGIPTMARSDWQFFRLRPANFPPLRIAQAAALLSPGGVLRLDALPTLAAALQQPRPLDAFLNCFDTPPDSFWTTHYRLERKSRKDHPAGIGRDRLERVLVNAVAPTLLLDAEQRQDRGLEEAIARAIRSCRPERDHVTVRFSEVGVASAHALITQGMHAVYREQCQEARCMACPIGRRALGEDSFRIPEEPARVRHPPSPDPRFRVSPHRPHDPPPRHHGGF